MLKTGPQKKHTVSGQSQQNNPLLSSVSEAAKELWVSIFPIKWFKREVKEPQGVYHMTVYDSLIHRCPLPTGWESRLPPIQPVDDQKAAPPGSAEHHRPRRPARSGRRWRGVRGERRTQRDVLQRPALLRGTKPAKMVKNGGLSQKKMMILMVSWWLNQKDLGCGDIMIWWEYKYIYIHYI